MCRAGTGECQFCFPSFTAMRLKKNLLNFGNFLRNPNRTSFPNEKYFCVGKTLENKFLAFLYPQVIPYKIPLEAIHYCQSKSKFQILKIL